MWADFKTLSFLKIGSTVKKLFIVEKLHMRHYRQKKNVKNGAYATSQHRITFKPFDPIFKNESVSESAYTRPTFSYF